MVRKVIFPVKLIFVLLLLGFVSNCDESREYNKKGDLAYKAGDLETAREWYEKSAAMGNTAGKAGLALLTIREERLKAINKAIVDEKGWAYFALAKMYRDGDGFPASKEKFIQLLTKAAQLGHREAQFRLGRQYEHGDGVIQNATEAFNWGKKAAEQGHTIAQLRMSLAYLSGEGVTRDPLKAHMWLNIGLSAGDYSSEYEMSRDEFSQWKKSGRDLYDTINNELSPSQIAKAQEMARECVAKNYKGC